MRRPPAESSFLENLRESLIEARKYLNREQKEVAHGLTYAQLEDAVNEIVRQAEAKLADSNPSPALNFFVDTTPVPEAEKEPLDFQAPLPEGFSAEGSPDMITSFTDEKEVPLLPDTDEAVDDMGASLSPSPEQDDAADLAAPQAGDNQAAPEHESEERGQRGFRGGRGRGRPRGYSNKEGGGRGERRPRGPRSSGRPEFAGQEGRGDNFRRRVSPSDNRQYRGGRNGQGQRPERKDFVNKSTSGAITMDSSAPVPAAH